MNLVFRYRVKSLTGLLNQQARKVNLVWNFCNDRQKDALRFNRRWHTGFDLINLTTGCSKELGLHSGTINDVCQQYAKSRKQSNKPYLRYRGRKSLGWVPLKGRELKREGNAFRFAGNTFRVFYSRPLPEGKIVDGTNFSRDRRGNWFLNIVLELAAPPTRLLVRQVGIDLGLHDLAKLTTGKPIAAPNFYREAEPALAIAQRANKKRRVQAIHARTANRRHDFLHKLSTRLVREFDHIVVGNVNAAGLAKTSMAKSVLDAGWSTLRTQLAYKAVKHGAIFEEVDERFTTQICSNCENPIQIRSPRGEPRGIADLGIREWQCSDCGAIHDRDLNAAINILRRGRATLVAGISVL
ncbi:RNA-guided endonuclease InsQ/TnpB family protein [Pseudoduganella ginsengisoli]|uniref:IS200/IS605 family element transposase accessory protein TnpB n=1 Tax=Pseudoduganella ginsengisoli TaxID=1462440 RepID=A0A6L6Q7R5_9BURK|nr:RNA-guided endonuclease TnpB family protein [Pseudoduganella ginsengisoli]MTW05489.1 IS200/IS605 family element transposase accessory protein TnpB [Pseudoduganella ginsengisoli]